MSENDALIYSIKQNNVAQQAHILTTTSHRANMWFYYYCYYHKHELNSHDKHYASVYKLFGGGGRDCLTNCPWNWIVFFFHLYFRHHMDNYLYSLGLRELQSHRDCFSVTQARCFGWHPWTSVGNVWALAVSIPKWIQTCIFFLKCCNRQQRSGQKLL